MKAAAHVARGAATAGIAFFEIPLRLARQRVLFSRPIAPMLDPLAAGALPAWVAAPLLATLLCAAAWVLSHALGRQQRHIGTGDEATDSKAAGPLTPPPPPVVPGLPLLGSALALGSGGAGFLQRCREQHGDAFTLRLLGQRMTFVFAPPALERYFTAPDSELTFGPAVQQFTHRVFGLPPKHFFSRHTTMLQTLRHLLVPVMLPEHTARLLRLLLARLQRWPASGQLELVGEIKTLVFEASVGALFGERFLRGLAPDGSSSGGGSSGSGTAATNGGSSGGGGAASAEAAAARARRLQEDFFAFEEGFELAASPVPHLLQPRFLAACRRLVAALRESFQAGHFKGTVAGGLIEACGLPDRHVPNMLLAVLWASQANAVPTAFWTLGFLLLPENRAHLQAVVDEAAAAVNAAQVAAGKCSSEGLVAGSDCEQQQQQEQQEKQQQQQGQQGQQEPPLLTEAQQRGLVSLACDRHSKAAAAVAEAMRLRSFSIDVRIAASDCVLPCDADSKPGGAGTGVLVRKGDVVAISPYSSHLDPRLYCQQPAAFDPDREGMQLGGSSAPHAAVVGVGGVPGLSFGGGKYRCPGRYFAEAELSLITSLLLLLFDWQLLPREASAAAGGTAKTNTAGTAAGGTAGTAAVQQSGPPGDPAGLLPPPDLRKLVGIKVPAGPCWVQYSRRRL
ncbi:hypothetical protein ABPG75_010645 [Micractinium tetrahymenae]